MRFECTDPLNASKVTGVSLRRQYASHLIDEEDAWRELCGEGEAGAHIAHAVAQPLGRDRAGVDSQERRAALGRRRARQQRLARACSPQQSLAHFNGLPYPTVPSLSCHISFLRTRKCRSLAFQQPYTAKPVTFRSTLPHGALRCS